MPVIPEQYISILRLGSNPNTRHTFDLLCPHMVRHVFPISTQEFPGAGQLETLITIRLMGLG